MGQNESETADSQRLWSRVVAPSKDNANASDTGITMRT